MLAASHERLYSIDRVRGEGQKGDSLMSYGCATVLPHAASQWLTNTVSQSCE